MRCPFLNCIALDTDDPTEINIGLDFLRKHPDIVERMRSDAQETAESFSWKNVVEDNLLGKLRYVALRQLVTPPGKSAITATAAAKTAATAPKDRQAAPAAPAPGAGGTTPASGAASKGAEAPWAGGKAAAGEQDRDRSIPYGGGSVGRRPPIKPQTSDT